MIHVVRDPRGHVSTLRAPGERAFFFDARLVLDVDGAPRAYHPPTPQRPFGSPPALDDLRNAGKLPQKAGDPGQWWGIATLPTGFPCIQGPTDPAPGFFVSMTALGDPSIRNRCNPARYVDATTIPYISLPLEVKRAGGARLGDFAAVYNVSNGKTAYAIYADSGPANRIGEGSVALARALGMPVHGHPVQGGQSSGVVYVVFPGSGNGRPRPLLHIFANGLRLFLQWGGTIRIADHKLVKLMDAVQRMALPRPLVATLQSAHAAVRKPGDRACTDLANFIRQVQALPATSVRSARRTWLVREASQIRTALSCSG
jgi:hypothetical protein